MFGRKHKIRKAVDRALASVDDETDGPELASIEALAPGLQAEAYHALAEALFADERYPAARLVLERALALAADAVELHQLAASIAAEEQRPEDVIAALAKVVAARPDETSWRVSLGTYLVDAERIEEAIELLEPYRGDPEIDTCLAEAKFVHGQSEEALAILDEVCAHYDAALKRAMGAEWHELKSRADDAARLRDDVYAELHGREATIELSAAAGKLDGTAGVNYRLLGARLAATSDRIADVLELEDPDATERRARRLLDDATDVRGLVLLGSAQLRRGEVAAARKTFDRACEIDGRCFAAFFGLGAALDHERYELHRRARALPDPGTLPALTAVVPDLAVLTEVERRVVWASAHPLARWLPVVADSGATMRVLPIDVRATDIGLFADGAGLRADDHRSYDAIGGLATHGGAIAKIEELLDVVTDGGWTFAHELAHLVFFHMPEEHSAPLVGLYEQALEIGYANTDYSLSNPDEFFAVSYTDWLRVRNELPGGPIEDDAGVQASLLAYFDGLAR